MKTRAITGFFFVLIMLSAVVFSPYSFSVFFVLLGIGSLIEFFKLIGRADERARITEGVLLALALFVPIVLFNLGLAPLYWLWLSVPFIALIYIRELYRQSVRPFQQIAFTFFGLLYAVFPFILFSCMAFLSGTYTYYLPMGFLFLLWTNDTGAYLVGMKFGKRKLFERHSPKKTWEGFIGGVCLALLVGFVLAQYYPQLATWQWLGMAFLISIFGTLGDLTESMLKRSYQVKDSGTLLPGHGGLLDRFDGLLMAAPLVYVFLRITLSY